ncbi:hypothetical protein [Microbacterium gorillae]|uniref:hypothetical protein n=1 Tax=Microbacterium gorillae TaxID=1231063 RepID=UPI003D975A08
MSATPLCRASARALLYFSVLVSFLMVGFLMSSSGADFLALIGPLAATAFIAAIIGTVPTMIAYLLALVLQRTLDHSLHRWVHRLTAGVLAGTVALGVMALLPSPFSWPYRLGVVVIVVLSASTAAVLAWEVTRRKIDRAALRYGVHG